jgi:uncharacterized protein with HEPN domain
VTRREAAWLADAAAAVAAIRKYQARGSLTDELVFDAVRMRLVEIGEAVKSLPTELTGTEPGVPWREIARMRDHLAHHYFDTNRELVERVLARDLAPLGEAIRRLATQLSETDPPSL